MPRKNTSQLQEYLWHYVGTGMLFFRMFNDNRLRSYVFRDFQKILAIKSHSS